MIAILAEAECSKASSVVGLVSCSGRTEIHSAAGSPLGFQTDIWEERGVGINQRDALIQTADFLIQRHLNVLLDRK